MISARRRRTVATLLLAAVTALGSGCAATIASGHAQSTKIQSALDTARAEPVEVRFICLAPSPYTGRKDSLRAGYGIVRSLQILIEEHDLPLRVTYYDGSDTVSGTSAPPDSEEAERAASLVRGAGVLIIGGSTWSQGPAFYLRRFFEFAGGENLGGVSAGAWATAGGAHTGGEVVVDTTLRSLMGMGAQTFSLGQKYMVFTTDERDGPTPGEFTLLDVWFMDQFARTIAVVALKQGDPAGARLLADALGTNPVYYVNLPEDLSPWEPLQLFLNAAADLESPESSALRDAMSPGLPTP
ncbi:MAG: hypothetical protein ACI8S6_004834 [Myxococcota bacterium]|jgi:hypothetical protein